MSKTVAEVSCSFSLVHPNPFHLLDPGIQERECKEESIGDEKSSSS